MGEREEKEAFADPRMADDWRQVAAGEPHAAAAPTAVLLDDKFTLARLTERTFNVLD